MSQILGRLRVRAGVLLAVLSVAAGSVPAVVLPTAAAAAKHHKKHHHRSNCIPQGNRGDNDPDNHGGPSDGDGCV